MSAIIGEDVERKGLNAQWPADGIAAAEISMKEVASHKQKDDIWIAIHGKGKSEDEDISQPVTDPSIPVYDITSYLQEHPGGAESLLEVAGTDATTAYEDVGHSEDAREIMAKYLRGNVKDADQSIRRKPVKLIQKTPVAASNEATSQSFWKAGAIATISFGAAGLILNFHHKLPALPLHQLQFAQPLLDRISSFSLLRGSDNGFLKGFLLAATLSGVIGGAIVDRISKAASITSGFLRYPPHMKAVSVPARHPAGFLTPNTYKKLTLSKVEALGDGLIRLTYELPTPTTVLGLPIGQHVAIKALVGDQFVTRSYTPVSNNRDLGRLELVLRIYPDGLLTGGYLSKLQVGDETEFRGPKGAMRYRKGWANSIGMIAGGTGITPMYQLIRAICEDDTDTTQVSLVYANRSEEDILLREELERFARQYPKNFKFWFMLDHPAEDWKYGRGYITREVLEERMPSPSSDSSTKVLLCGPPGMVNAAKKSLVDLSWKAPGAVSKMADDIFCF